MIKKKKNIGREEIIIYFYQSEKKVRIGSIKVLARGKIRRIINKKL